MPGIENTVFIATVLVSIAGSVVANYAGQAVGWYAPGQGAVWIGSILGTFALLWVYQRINSGSAGA